MGGKTTENLFNAVLDEYSVQGKDKILEIEEVAKNRGIDYKSIVKRGTFLDVALSVVEKERCKPDFSYKAETVRLIKIFFRISRGGTKRKGNVRSQDN